MTDLILPTALIICALTSIGSGIAVALITESALGGLAAACLAPVVLVVALLLAPFFLAAFALYFAAVCVVTPFHAVATVFRRKESKDG